MYNTKQIQVIPELYNTGNLTIIKKRLNHISNHPDQYSKEDLVSTIRFLEDLVSEI